MQFKYDFKSNTGGLYQITNTTNGRFYIGQTSCFKKRWHEHKTALLREQHFNQYLQADFNKCGSDSFVFEVLEVITEPAIRNEREEMWLNDKHDKCEQCYNIRTHVDVGANRIFSNDPVRTKQLLSEATKRSWQKPEYRNKISKAQTERLLIMWQDDERKQRQSEAQKKAWASSDKEARKIAIRQGLLASTKNKMPRAGRRNFHFISPEGVSHEGINLRQFCLEHNLAYKNMSGVLNGHQNSHQGWRLL